MKSCRFIKGVLFTAFYNVHVPQCRPPASFVTYDFTRAWGGQSQEEIAGRQTTHLHGHGAFENRPLMILSRGSYYSAVNNRFVTCLAHRESLPSCETFNSLPRPWSRRRDVWTQCLTIFLFRCWVYTWSKNHDIFIRRNRKSYGRDHPSCRERAFIYDW